jgi:hypothetical protein
LSERISLNPYPKPDIKVKENVRMYSHERKAGVLSRTFNRSTHSMTPIWQPVLVFPVQLGENFV